MIGDDTLENMLLVITKGGGTANIQWGYIKMFLVKITNLQVVIVHVVDLKGKVESIQCYVIYD